MSEASSWRARLGRQVAAAYATDPNTVAVLIAGSTGRGTADRYSDLEIDVYYERAPTETERTEAVRRSGGALIGLDADEMEWEEQISFAGFPVTSSTFLAATMDDCLDRVADRGEIDLEAQTRLYSLQHALPVVGEGLIAAWRARAAQYPESLVHAMLGRYLPTLGSFGPTEGMLVERADLLLLHRRLVTTQRAIIGVLLALNRIYAPTPDHDKGVAELISAMAHTPEDLIGRLRAVWLAEPSAGVELLAAVIADVVSLVAEHVPRFDLAAYRSGPVALRFGWDGPPMQRT